MFDPEGADVVVVELDDSEAFDDDDELPAVELLTVELLTVEFPTVEFPDDWLTPLDAFSTAPRYY